MSSIIQRVPWTVIPRSPTKVNLGNSISRQLILAAVPGSGGYYDGSPYQDHQITAVGAGRAVGYGPTTGAHTTGTSSDGWKNRGSAPAPSSAFSIALWVRFPTTPTAYGAMVARVGTVGATDAGGDWQIAASNTNRYLIYSRNGEVINGQTSIPVAADVWRFHALTIDSSGSQWYIDSGRVMSTFGSGATARIRTGTGAIGIGNNGVASGTNSAVGRVYIWNRKVSQAELTAILQNEAQLFAPQTRRIFVGGAAAPPSTFIPSWARRYTRIIGAGF